MSEASTDRMLSTVELAERLGVTVVIVRHWRDRGVGPQGIRLSYRTVRYPESEVERWLEEQRQQDPLNHAAG